MRDISHEPSVLVLRGLEAADRLRQRVGHPVEPVCPGPELVVGSDRDPGEQVAALDALGGPARFLDRQEDPTCQRAGKEQRHDDQDHSAAQEHGPKLADGRVDLRDVAYEVDR